MCFRAYESVRTCWAFSGSLTGPHQLTRHLTCDLLVLKHGLASQYPSQGCGGFYGALQPFWRCATFSLVLVENKNNCN